MQERGAEVTQKNLERAEQLREDAKTFGPVPEAVEYVFGTPEGLEEIKNLRREATIDPNMELVAGLELEEKTPVAETPAAEKPAEKAASFRVLPPAEPKPTETKSAFLSGLDNLSTGDLLKLSGAFFQAGSQGTTGSAFGDLTQFLGSAGITSGDVINAAEKRKLAAADKKFLRGLKEREVTAAETKAKAALRAAELKNLPEFKTPTDRDISYAKTTLQDRGLNISDAAVREVAAIQKAYPQLTREQVVSMLIQQGNLSVDEPGFFRSLFGADPEVQLTGE